MEVPLPILVTYVRLASVSTDILIDALLDLPDKLPKHKHKLPCERQNVARRFFL
jgi:hypothetical protein